MVGFFPVETGALNKKQTLIADKVEHELYVACYVKTFAVNFREKIEGAFRFYSAKAGYLADKIENRIPLFAQAAAGKN